LGLPCDISKDDVVIPERCPILGIPLSISSKTIGDSSPSIDRIIPDRGYVKGNIVVVSFRANRIKNDATVEELETVANWLRNHGQ
jgi:hypothetical protein